MSIRSLERATYVIQVNKYFYINRKQIIDAVTCKYKTTLQLILKFKHMNFIQNIRNNYNTRKSFFIDYIRNDNAFKY